MVARTYLQIFTVAAIEVALPSRGPGVLDVIGTDSILNHLGFLGGLERDEVLTVFAADVAGIQPVALAACCGPVPPGVEVVVAIAELVGVLHSCRETRDVNGQENM